MFTGNKYARWDKFIPVHLSRRRGFWPTIKFYLFALRKPPGFVGHNPVAGATYTLVFGLYLVAISTGLAMRGASADLESPLRWFASLAPLIGGLQIVRWIHHVVMWLLLGFTVHHVYSGVLMSTIEANATMESIFSGYKFVPREDLQFSGYRFINRRGQVDE
jgi:Ni/Fe-hydrogenase 1 B-type cytochrome subunit